MKYNTTKEEYQTAVARAQFFLENYSNKTYREMACTFGWINEEISKKDYNRAIQRVKNIRTSLIKIGFKVPQKTLARKNLVFIKIDEEKFPINKPKTRQGMPRRGYNRYTIIVKDEYYEEIQRIHKETKKPIREIMDEILTIYFEKES